MQTFHKKIVSQQQESCISPKESRLYNAYQLLPEEIFNLKIKIMLQRKFNSRDAETLDLSPYIMELRNKFQKMRPEPTGIKPSLSNSRNAIKAVLLDIYGTLLISEAGDIGLVSDKNNDDSSVTIFADGREVMFPYSRIRQVLIKLIQTEHTAIKTEDTTIEYPEVDIIRIWDSLYATFEIPSYDIRDLVRTALHYEIQTNKIWLMPETRQLLDSLQKKSIPTGIVSNAQFYTPAFLEHLLGRSLKDAGIDESLSSWSYRLGRGKPDLFMFEKSLTALQNEHNIYPENVLYIGNDMLNDIYTASEMGLQTALFAGDTRSLRLREQAPQTAGIKPDYIITGLNQILSYIGEEGK